MIEKTNDCSYTGLEIAVIGMSCKLPKAKTINEYWDLLKNGKETASMISDEELLKNGVDKKLLNHPQYVKRGNYLENKDCFDSIFFDYLPSEAKVMDPQMRIFHEIVWEALEDAGYTPDDYNGLIGLFAGAGANYNWQSIAMIENENNHVDNFSAQQLNNKDFMTTKISYKLNLKGPSVFIQTACSTSLVAVHMACRSILMGECNIAIAGGVTVLSTPKTGYLYSEGMVLSPDGHCRAFDADAQGTVFGEGAGVVVLKRLKNAIADGDNIHAVIKGSAINNDGSRKVGYTAPSIEGQVEVLRLAQKTAKVDPKTISYIEAHGTGTSLGDPIEVGALNIAFGKSDRRYCGIGSVKSNIGHLDTAAGVISLIKTILSLKNRMLPPSINFNKLNPKINFLDSPFYVNTSLKEWSFGNDILRAGVSSLGIGGTNAHVIVEEAPEVKSQEKSRNYQLMVFSAKTAESIDKTIINLTDYLKNNSKVNLADVSYTLQKGRKHFPYRKFIVCNNYEHAIKLLEDASYKNKYNIIDVKNRVIVFLFTGQGSQYADMGRTLYKTEALFKEEIDNCFDIVFKISRILKDESLNSEENIYKILNHPDHAQIALFSFEYSLAKYLCRLGIKPDIVLGHSLGEYVAACISGVFTLEEALKLIIVRERIMNTLPQGSMLSVSLGEHELSRIIESYEISLAAVNGPKSCVLSGDSQLIDKAETELVDNGVVCQKLHTPHAYHSKDIDEIIPLFRQELLGIVFHSPQIPLMSNLTGDFISENEINVEYWCRHLRNTIRFSDGVNNILEKNKSLFIEVGPGRTLSALIRQHISNESKNQNKQLITNIIRHPKEDICDQYYLMNRIGELWSYGLMIDWNNFYYNEKRKRISLPTYPFQEIKYTAVGDPYKILSERMAIRTPGKKPDVLDWFYVPSWVSKPLISKMEIYTGKINLILGEDTDLTNSIVTRFKVNGEKTVKVFMGDQFKKISKNYYIINMNEPEQYNRLAASLKASGCIPNRVIHLMNIYEDSWNPALKVLQDKIKKGLYSLLNMIKAMEKSNILTGAEIAAITNDLHKVLGTEQVSPEKSLVTGLLKVLSQEYLSVKSINIDVSLLDDKKIIANNIFHELSYNSSDKTVSYRGQMRWVQHYSSINLHEDTEVRGRIKNNGTYLVVGGLGKLGLEICKHLTIKYKSKVIIFGRTDFTKDIENNDDFTLKKSRLMELNDLAKDNVTYFRGDITRYQDIKNCIRMIEENYVTLDGVIYAAGVLNGQSISTIETLTENEFEEQFDSKLYGLLALKRVLKKRNLDFCVVVSSLSSVLGGLRYSAYAAANTFIDYYIQYINNKNWISVNLDGLNFDTGSEADLRAKNYNIDKQEAIDVFDQIINHIEVSQVIVSTGDLQERINKWINQTEEQNQSTENFQDVTKERPYMSSAYKAPNNAVQKKLTEIWHDFFGINNIGIEDNFFELGGDSLKAVTISKKIYKEFNIEITLAEFFNNMSIKELAACIESKSTSSTTTIDTEEDIVYFDEWDQKIIDDFKKSNPNIHDIYPLTYMQLSALNYNIMYSNTEYTVQVVTCLLENLNTIKFKNAWKKVIEMHSILRTDFVWRKLHAPVQIIYKDTPLSFEELDWRGMPKEQQDQQAKEYVREIKNSKFKKVPLMNVTLIRLNDRQHRLIWCYQNMLFDGWSAEIILNDLIAIYNNKIGKLKKSIRTPYDFVNYINWLYLKEQKDAELFWKKEFEGFDYSSLSNKKNEPASEKHELLMSSIKFATDEKKIIKNYSVKNNLSLYTLIVSCWAILQSSSENKKDIVIGTMTSGRPLTLEGIDTMVGLFTNVIPIRITIPDTEISKKWLTYVQNKLHNCKEFEYVSLPQIASWCSIPYEVLRKAIYEKTIVYVDYPTDETIQLDGVDDYSSQGGLLVPLRIITGPELNFCIKYDREKHSETEVVTILDKMRKLLLWLCNVKND